jgi:hypothetical protein
MENFADARGGNVKIKSQLMTESLSGFIESSSRI